MNKQRLESKIYPRSVPNTPPIRLPAFPLNTMVTRRSMPNPIPNSDNACRIILVCNSSLNHNNTPTLSQDSKPPTSPTQKERYKEWYSDHCKIDARISTNKRKRSNFKKLHNLSPFEIIRLFCFITINQYLDDDFIR